MKKQSISTEKIGETADYVYDISLDGTVVNALGYNVMSNTDGFNFKKPSKFRYTDENPYIGLGKGRNSVAGKKYTGVEADVCEFEDLFVNEAYNGGILKNGLGIDEFCDACIQFSRKNYADLMPDGSVKLVGNSIKSKKMPLYIENFLNVAIKMLLQGQGKAFLEFYYDYVEKIYNLQIPLKEIASVGKIKTSIEEYKKGCKELTKSGSKKARQAWYELAIQNDLNVNMGDSIYYINTGTKKNDSDVKRVTEYYSVIDGVKQNVTKQVKKVHKDAQKSNGVDYYYKMQTMTYVQFAESMLHMHITEEDELSYNCILLPNEIVEDEEPHYCDDTFEYNVAKYIEMFNKRITPLLVCFSTNIRYCVNEKGKTINNILITNPKDRKCFTEEESVLVCGQPYKPTDQDTYEQLMTIEDKEIKFWLKIDKKPPYVDECGMDWEKIKSDYRKRMPDIDTELFEDEMIKYNSIISQLTDTDIDNFNEDGTLPTKLMDIVFLDKDNTHFLSKKFNVTIGTIYDIIEREVD